MKCSNCSGCKSGGICNFVAVRISEDGSISMPAPPQHRLVPENSGLAYALIDEAITKEYDQAFPNLPAGVGTMVDTLGDRWPTEIESTYARQRIQVARYWYDRRHGVG